MISPQQITSPNSPFLASAQMPPSLVVPRQRLEHLPAIFDARQLHHFRNSLVSIGEQTLTGNHPKRVRNRLPDFDDAQAQVCHQAHRFEAGERVFDAGAMNRRHTGIPRAWSYPVSVDTYGLAAPCPQPGTKPSKP